MSAEPSPVENDEARDIVGDLGRRGSTGDPTLEVPAPHKPGGSKKKASFREEVEVSSAEALAAANESGGHGDLDAPIGLGMPVPRLSLKRRNSHKASIQWASGKETARKSLALGNSMAATRALRQSARLTLNELSSQIGAEQYDYAKNFRKSVRQSSVLGFNMAEEILVKVEELEELVLQKEEDLRLAAEIGQQLVQQTMQMEEDLDAYRLANEELQRELQATSQASTMELLQYRSELQGVKMKNDDLREEVEELKELNAEYEDSLSSLRQERQRHMRDLAQLQSLQVKLLQFDELQSSNEQLQELVMELEEENSRMHAWQAKWEEIKAQYDEDMAELRIQLDLLTQAKAAQEQSFKSRIANLEKQLADVQNAKYETEIDREDALSELRRQREQLGTDQSQLPEHIRLLEEEVKRLSEYQLRDRAKIAELEKQLEEANATITSLEDEVGGLNTQLQALRAKSAQHETTLLEWEQKGTGWDAERTRREKESSSLKEEVETLKEKLSQQSAEMMETKTELETKLSESKEVIERQEAELIRLRKDQKELSEEKTLLKRSITEFQSTPFKDAAAEATEAVSSSSAPTSQELLLARMQIQKLETELEAMTESRDNLQQQLSEIRSKMEAEVKEATDALQHTQSLYASALKEIAALKSGSVEQFNNSEVERLKSENEELIEKLSVSEKGVEEWRQKQIRTVKARETRRIPTADISGLQVMAQQMDELKARIQTLEKENESLRNMQKQNTDADHLELRELRQMVNTYENTTSDMQKQLLEYQALAREQMEPQTQNETTITQLRNQVAEMTRKMDELSETVRVSQELLAQKERLLEEMKADQSALAAGGESATLHLQESVAAMRAERDRLEAELAAVSSGLSESEKTKATIAELQQAVEHLQGENQKWCDCVVAQFEYHRQLFRQSNPNQPLTPLLGGS